MTYAKLVSETAIDRTLPRRGRDEKGRLVVGDLTACPAALSALGFLPLDETPEPETPPPDGTHYEPRYALSEDEKRIGQTWVAIADPPPPPRTFSKLRIVAALMDAGYWPQVKAYVEGAGLWDLYLAAQTFREDDPHFAPALAALKTALGVADEAVEAILEAATVD